MEQPHWPQADVIDKVVASSFNEKTSPTIAENIAPTLALPNPLTAGIYRMMLVIKGGGKDNIENVNSIGICVFNNQYQIRDKIELWKNENCTWDDILQDLSRFIEKFGGNVITRNFELKFPPVAQLLSRFRPIVMKTLYPPPYNNPPQSELNRYQLANKLRIDSRFDDNREFDTCSAISTCQLLIRILQRMNV